MGIRIDYQVPGIVAAAMQGGGRRRKYPYGGYGGYGSSRRPKYAQDAVQQPAGQWSDPMEGLSGQDAVTMRAKMRANERARRMGQAPKHADAIPKFTSQEKLDRAEEERRATIKRDEERAYDRKLLEEKRRYEEGQAGLKRRRDRLEEEDYYTIAEHAPPEMKKQMVELERDRDRVLGDDTLDETQKDEALAIIDGKFKTLVEGVPSFEKVYEQNRWWKNELTGDISRERQEGEGWMPGTFEDRTFVPDAEVAAAREARIANDAAIKEKEAANDAEKQKLAEAKKQKIDTLVRDYSKISADDDGKQKTVIQRQIEELTGKPFSIDDQESYKLDPLEEAEGGADGSFDSESNEFVMDGASGAPVATDAASGARAAEPEPQVAAKPKPRDGGMTVAEIERELEAAKADFNEPLIAQYEALLAAKRKTVTPEPPNRGLTARHVGADEPSRKAPAADPNRERHKAIAARRRENWLREKQGLPLLPDLTYEVASPFAEPPAQGYAAYGDDGAKQVGKTRRKKKKKVS